MVKASVPPNSPKPPEKEATSGAHQEAAFEFELQTGNRAQTVQPRTAGSSKAPAEVRSELARRRARARERWLLVRLGLVALTLAFTIWGTAKWWQPLMSGDVVARVNGQAITYQQVEKEIRLSKALSVAATGKEQSPAPPAMLEQLILLELEVQAAQQANFAPDPEDVSSEITNLIRQAGITPGKLDESLQSYGLTLDDLRASLARTTLAGRFGELGPVGNSTDPRERLTRVNQWQAELVQGARIERVRNSVAGIGPRDRYAGARFHP